MPYDIEKVIFENLKTMIPESIKDLIKSRKVRQEMLDKYGAKAFLDSKNLKFPVVNPKTGKYDCRLIYAAYIRASMFEKRGGTRQAPKSYYSNIRDKAIKLYESEKCQAKLKVEIHETGEEIDLMTYVDLFEQDFLKDDVFDFTESWWFYSKK